MKGKASKLLIALGFSLLGTLALGMSQYDVQPALAEGEKHVSLPYGHSDVTKGSSYFEYVYIDSLVDVATLNISLHYNSDAVRVNQIYNNVSCSIYDSSTNNDAINFSYIFASSGSGNQTNLFSFYYTVLSDTSLSNSYFDIVINEAYDFNLNSVSVYGSRFNFNILERESTKTCDIYGSSSINTKKEEEFDLTYRVSNTSIASGTFEIQYDRDLFEFVSLTQQGFLSNKMVDINTSLDGSVMVSFLGTEYSTISNVLNIKFKTIANEDTTSTIKFIASDLYDLDLDYISCSGHSTTIILSYDSDYDESIPSVSLSSDIDSNNDQVTILVTLASNSHLGAGDFVLNWNSTIYAFNSCTKKFNPTFFNVNDKFVSTGQLKFSIISLTDIVDANQVIEVVLDVNYPHDDTNTEFTIIGSGLADSLTEPIDLHFVGCTQVIPGRHFYEEEWTIDVQPTCTSEGSKSHHCSECDSKTDITVIPMLEHTPAAAVTENLINPTCTVAGSYDKVVYCSVCHTELSRDHHVINALGHDYDEWNQTIAPTCTEEGEEVHICKVCDHEESRPVSPLGHSYGDWSTTKEPTCTEAGSEHRICSVCEHEDVRPIDALGHDYSEEWTIDVEPTCTSVGSKSHHCSRCDSKTDITVIPMLDHTPAEAVQENIVNPTCTEKGSYDEVVYCSVCHTELSRTEREIPATGHSPAEAVRENVIGTDCSQPGSYDDVIYCDICHEELSREHHVVDVLDHTYGKWEVTTEPTCTEKGSEHRICSVCGHEDTRDIDPLGHDYGEWYEVSAPTCLEEGLEERICTRDEDHKETRPIEALGHDYSEEWTIDIEPTCTSEGSKSHHCSRCDSKTDVTSINKIDHTPVTDEAVEATCTETGLTEGSHCSVCEEVIVEQEEVPALGHDFGEWTVVTAPTFTSTGLEERVCSRDPSHKETRIIPKVDASPYFNDAVEAIDLDNDSLEESFNNIKRAIEYYRLVEDKESVSESYTKLQTIVDSYNSKVGKANENHNDVSKATLSFVLGIAAGINLLAAGLVLLRKKVLKV